MTVKEKEQWGEIQGHEHLMNSKWTRIRCSWLTNNIVQIQAARLLPWPCFYQLINPRYNKLHGLQRERERERACARACVRACVHESARSRTSAGLFTWPLRCSLGPPEATATPAGSPWRCRLWAPPCPDTADVCTGPAAQSTAPWETRSRGKIGRAPPSFTFRPIKCSFYKLEVEVRNSQSFIWAG